MALIYDILVCMLVVISAVSCYRQGFLSAMIELAGMLLSTLGAVFASRVATGPVFDLLFSGTIVEKIAQAVGDGEAGVAAAIETYASFLPQSMKDAILQRLGETIDFEEAQAAEHIVTEIIEPLVAPILSILIFFVAFLLLLLLVNMLRNIFRTANRVPLLGPLNRVLGGGLGILTGLLDAFIMMCLIWGAMAATNNTVRGINIGVLSGSYFYRIFEKVNPFI